MKTIHPIAGLWHALESYFYGFQVAWRMATSRWFVFRDVPSWLVQHIARYHEDGESAYPEDLRDAAEAEWALRKRRRNAERKERLS